MSSPVILITLDTGQADRRGVPLQIVQQKKAYAQAIEQAGGLPVWVSPTTSLELIEEFVNLSDAIIITGGDFDILPGHADQTETELLRCIKPERTGFETQLIRIALRRRVPLLGICGGMQLINVVFKGTLFADIKTLIPNAIEHEQPTSPNTPWHAISVVPDSILAQWIDTKEFVSVNSTHHQAIRELGEGLKTQAVSSDGVIEAIAHESLPIYGVQWHPELLGYTRLSQGIYRYLVQLAV